MVDREGGVENQPNIGTHVEDTETDLDNPPINTDEEISQQEEQNTNTNECVVCHKTFDTVRGLKIHEGKVCKKRTQCIPRSYKTRSQSTQEANHSGVTMETAEPSNELPQIDEIEPKKPKILWPPAKDKVKYKELEEEVLRLTSKDKGSTSDKLESLAKAIYKVGEKLFGVKEDTNCSKKKTVIVLRRNRKLERLRIEKKDLKKRFKNAPAHEKEGLTVLFNQVKEKSRLIQRSIRRAERRKKAQKTRTSFLKQPYEFAKKLFVEARNGTLECTKEQLDDHIKTTYSDEEREIPLQFIDGLKRPSEPGREFDLSDFKAREVDEFVRKARAKSAAGRDGVSYKVYKYCDKLRNKLFLLLRKMWKEGDLVDNWCQAEGIYLPKEKDSKEIGQFRPISLLNIDGKIFMGILAKRTISFLQRNGYVDEEVQKAGLPGIPGCVEHAFSIWEEIQRAKQEKQNLSVVWLDLANAYGSVPHKVLFKAMDHFYIPNKVQKIMKDYYGTFKMRFTTKSFTTSWHRLEVGIAAGCTISVIWFILVMEMILRSTDFTEERAMVKSPKKAFMDDITLLSKGPDAMLKGLMRLEELIRWARMKFKARKSRSLTFVKGVQKEIKYKIADEEMPTVREEPVKSLGRWYAGTLSDKSKGIEIQRQTEDGLQAIDTTKLPGKFKIWLLQFGLYLRLAWPLQMYEVALSRVEIIEQKINVKVRKWLCLPKMTNSAALYGRGGALELPLTAITELYKQGKVRTVMMLKDSKDDTIRSDPPKVKTARKWNAEFETEDIISELQHRDIVGASQDDRAGLGKNPFKPFSTMRGAEKRNAICATVKKREDEKRRLHLVQCPVQGQVTRWEESVIERKIGWKEIWQWTTSRTSFLIRSTYDVLPSPSNLVRWRIAENGNCRCGRRGTMKHILSNCQLALDRYTWRHNLILNILCNCLDEHLRNVNAGRRPQKRIPQNSIFFMKAGEVSRKKKKKEKVKDDKEWDGQWSMSADLPEYNTRLFPIPTTKKPDIVYWCEDRRVVVLVELTVPHEDNIQAAADRKDERYAPLLEELDEAGWKAKHYPVEIGCRGYVGHRTKNWLFSMGMPNKQVTSIINDLQATAEQASHWIWLKRDDQTWLEK